MRRLRQLFRSRRPLPATRLHIGSGPVRLAGWTNVDNAAYEGVDHVLDVTKGLPFSNVSFVFAEHFIEHLSFEDGVTFLRECRRILSPEGVLRLSTPNLDWVWLHQYHFGAWGNDGEAIRDCFGINKGFRAWGHQFLYNQQTLEATLVEAGFGLIEKARYGESRRPDLRGLERHEQYPDEETVPHVIVLEASGKALPGSKPLEEHRREFQAVIDLK